MKQHELKTDPEVFQESWDGRKGYEIRLNDRDYQVGDRITLKETRYSGAEMAEGKPLEFTGRTIVAIINGIITGYGLGEGWVILNYEGFTGYQADQESKHERWSLTWQLEQQAARIADLDQKLNQAIDLLDINQRSALLMEWSQLEAKGIQPQEAEPGSA